MRESLATLGMAAAGAGFPLTVGWANEPRALGLATVAIALLVLSEPNATNQALLVSLRRGGRRARRGCVIFWQPLHTPCAVGVLNTLAGDRPQRRCRSQWCRWFLP